MAVNFSDYFSATLTTKDSYTGTAEYDHLVYATLTLTNKVGYDISLQGTLYIDDITSNYITVKVGQTFTFETIAGSQTQTYDLGDIYSGYCSGSSSHPELSCNVYFVGQYTAGTEWYNFNTNTTLPSETANDTTAATLIANVDAINLHSHATNLTPITPKLLECYNDANNNIYIKVQDEYPSGSWVPFSCSIIDNEGTLLLNTDDRWTMSTIETGEDSLGNAWTLYGISPEVFSQAPGENTTNIIINIGIGGYWAGGEYGSWDTITGTYELKWYNGITIYILIDGVYQAGKLYVKNGTSKYSPAKSFSVLKED